jgi:hypothetical protein
MIEFVSGSIEIVLVIGIIVDFTNAEVAVTSSAVPDTLVFLPFLLPFEWFGIGEPAPPLETQESFGRARF